MRRSISSSASWRNAAAVFFQLLQFVFILDHGHRTQLTDLAVDLDQLLAQAVELPVLLDLLLYLFQFRSQGQISSPGLASYAGIPEVLGSVARRVPLGTRAAAL